MRSPIYLLNSLGECYYRLGSEDEALAAWEKSLEINPNQPEIKKKIKAIKK
ncbi:MAG: tetratricopeptide repeat protein [Candidatus Aminicenantes bacterium]|nr:MAG: tetratricopeptide repeat protein [Candidatus Aminicenantes bacterium]